MPKRIQRKRTVGWRKPEGTINCTRPGKYGNPFKAIGNDILLDVSFRFGKPTWRWWQYGDTHQVTMFFKFLLDGTFDTITDTDIQHWVKHFKDLNLKETLRDHDLMCFCSLSDDCHVDVLLEIANS